jgi:nucleoside phosphorylase/CheY-like chemotaxis protein
MKILLLEDEDQKRADIVAEVRATAPAAEITEVKNWLDYSNRVHDQKFDLILLDLLVPRSARDPRIEDHHVQLIETTRAYGAKSFLTPAIVLTKFLDTSEAFFPELNKVDITVISFDDNGEWKPALAAKIRASEPKVRYEYIIVCALAKEVAAYESTSSTVGPLRTVSGLACREITIDGSKGTIVQLPRMGLVSSAVVTAYAIERFEPKLVCMSGICGGIPGNSEIYDLLISDVCHQHDVGKWGDDGFRAEHYDIQLRPTLRNRLEELVHDGGVAARLIEGLELGRSEYPESMERFKLNMRLAPMSSGSAVMAEQGKTASLTGDQRKLAGFDMEIFSVYEAARLSHLEPSFFAVKSVVDDGDRNKGDRFHRVGALLSARFVVETIRSGALLLC